MKSATLQDEARSAGISPAQSMPLFPSGRDNVMLRARHKLSEIDAKASSYKRSVVVERVDGVDGRRRDGGTCASCRHALEFFAIPRDLIECPQCERTQRIVSVTHFVGPPPPISWWRLGVNVACWGGIGTLVGGSAGAAVGLVVSLLLAGWAVFQTRKLVGVGPCQYEMAASDDVLTTEDLERSPYPGRQSS